MLYLNCDGYCGDHLGYNLAGCGLELHQESTISYTNLLVAFKHTRIFRLEIFNVNRIFLSKSHVYNKLQ